MAQYGFKNMDPRVDPESAKRLASGFWSHHYSYESGHETWSCDKRKLNNEVAKLMANSNFTKRFAIEGPRILDQMFGEGTAKAFNTKTEGDRDRVHMRIDPFEREKMGLSSFYKGNHYYKGVDVAASSGTSATYTTTTNTSALSAEELRMMQEQVLSSSSRQMERYFYEMIGGPERAKKEPRQKKAKPATKKVETFPFKKNKWQSLVEQLQREFDKGHKEQMKVLYG